MGVAASSLLQECERFFQQAEALVPVTPKPSLSECRDFLTWAERLPKPDRPSLLDECRAFLTQAQAGGRALCEGGPPWPGEIMCRETSPRSFGSAQDRPRAFRLAALFVAGKAGRRAACPEPVEGELSSARGSTWPSMRSGGDSSESARDGNGLRRLLPNVVRYSRVDD
jgi:hypothetical protein